MRFVNQFDVKFLSEAALLDSLFKNLTGIPLLDAEVCCPCADTVESGAHHICSLHRCARAQRIDADSVLLY
jgi:hypothetical protein